MSIVIQDTKEVSSLSREAVVDILRALQEPECEQPTWNVVDALELLIDAGQFSAAHQLSDSVAQMVAGDGRRRLFEGYSALCKLMEAGEQRSSLEILERLYIEINNGGHSVPDKVRIGLLLARAIALCISVGSSSERFMLRARSILSVELERVSKSGDADLEAQVVTELAKCYLYAPTSDALAACAILTLFLGSQRFEAASAARAFDVRRALFQAQKRLGADVGGSISGDLLRQESQRLGGIVRALTELTIARGGVDIALDRVEWALEVFEDNEFISGAFEAVFVLATDALDRGHNVVAGKYWRRALGLAEKGGFLHGRLLSLMGLFQCAMLGEDLTQAHTWLAATRKALTSELALGSAGLNVAAAQQMVGDYSGALATAKRCESFFKERQLFGFQAQSANIIGTCEAQLGCWQRARLAWSRAAALDRQRCAFVVAAEREGLVAQAWLMGDVDSKGLISPATSRKVTDILQRAESDLKSFGELDEAVRVRARLHAVHAHLCVLCGEHVRSLRYLSNAREMFDSLGLYLDVAMTDGFTALSMLEVGKKNNPGLAEESVTHLQRALQFFSSVQDSSMKWKLLYYLSVAAVVVSQSKSAEHEKSRWRGLAIAWIREAEKESLLVTTGAQGALGGEVAYAGFSPGLTPASIKDVKNALGIREKPGKQRDDTLPSLHRLPEHLH